MNRECVVLRREPATCHFSLSPSLEGAAQGGKGENKFLGTHIGEDLTWSHNTLQIPKEERKFGSLTRILSNYRDTVESVLITSITVWYTALPRTGRLPSV